MTSSGSSIDTTYSTDYIGNEKPRVNYLDNLRVTMTLTVIIHHLGMAYANFPPWYYLEVPTDFISQLLITVFLGINQAYFMGLLFMISGYFTPTSIEKKGVKLFAKDRLIRLGIPLLFFMFIIHPVLFWINQIVVEHNSINFFVYYSQNILYFSSMTGPMWYILCLILYTFGFLAGYILYKKIRGNSDKKPIVPHFVSESTQNQSNQHSITLLNIQFFGIFIGILSYLVRSKFPGTSGFPAIAGLGIQIGYAPQYISLFLFGALASKKGYLNQFTKKIAHRSLLIGLFSLALVVSVVLLTGALDDLMIIMGGWGYQAFLFAFFESIFCVNLIVFLIYFFQKKVNYKGKINKWITSKAYVVYVIHPLFVVLIMIAIRNILLSTIPKFLIASSLTIIICFIIGWLILKVPGMKRIVG